MKKGNKTVKDLKNSDNLFNFLSKSYNEAVYLITFSRNYFTERGKADKLNLSREDSLVYTLAMSTITTQLSSVLSWLLVCRAVQEGEVKLNDLKSEDFRMPEFDLNIDDDSCFSSLNGTVREMLKRSSSLYNRIKRMENSIQEKFLKEEPCDSPLG